MSRRILFLQYTDPAAYPPLEHASIILGRNGWRVLFLGVFTPDTAALTFAPNAAAEIKIMAHAPPGWRQKLHFIRYTLWAAYWTLRWRPNAIYASDLLSCPAAWLSGALSGAGIVYHEHDSPNPLAEGAGAAETPFQRILRWTRRRVAARAEANVLPNRERARIFREETGTARPVLVVWNCPRKEETGPPRESHHGPAWLLYHGTLGPERLPEHMIDLLPAGLGLRVAGYESAATRGYVERLRVRAAELGCADRFDPRGAIPSRAELLAICRSADIGISTPPVRTSNVNLRHMAGASNKAFDYLACGLPILVSDSPEWRAIFCEAGVAVACDPDDPASVRAAIGWLTEDPGRLRQMGEKGRQKILTEWNYETQFQPVLEALGRLQGAA